MSVYKRCTGHLKGGAYRCECSWYADVQVDGRRVRRALHGYLSKPEAEKELVKITRALNEGEFAELSAAPRNVTDLLARYVKERVEVKELAYAGKLEYQLGVLQRKFGHLTVEQFCKPAPLALLLEDLKSAGTAPGTRNRYRALWKTIARWARGYGWARTSPFDNNSNGAEREHNERRRRICVAEERMLVTHATDPVMKARIQVAIYTGLRRNEMLTLQVQHIDFAHCELKVEWRHAKSRRTRRIPLANTHSLWAFLHERAVLGADAYVFGTQAGTKALDFRTAWENTCCRAFGIPLLWDANNCLAPESRAALKARDLHWHDLRHEFGSRLAMAGVPLSKIRDLMGHSSIVTTQRYDHSTQQELRDAVKVLTQSA